MPRNNRDLDKAATRFLSALARITSGLETQQQRIVNRAIDAPRILVDSPYEVIDLTGDSGSDIDYYVYELGRLDAASTSIIGVFGPAPELATARATFHAAIPNLKRIRNPLTHPNDNDLLDTVAWFSSIVLLNDDGSVEQLVDPRYEQHDAALAFSQALTQFLRRHVKQSIADDPSSPLTEQIRQRDAKG